MHQGPLNFSGHDVSAKEKVPDSEVWQWKGLFRGLLWRLKLGVLPPLSPCVEELRRAAADGRRKYAELRRRLLVDPHAMEVSQNPRPLNMDNPLSQDPDSVWSRHFQISELQETIDKDLTRLYPEHGDFFQSNFCQAMLRRILLVWSLMHPSCSYRQGMHELLAPLLYVLHCDVIFLSKVKQRYEDVFDDRFEEPFCLESGTHENGGKPMTKGFVCYKAAMTFEDSLNRVDIGSLERISGQKCGSLQGDEWNYGLKILVMGTDTYGAEGELGVLFSGRFAEHDAFSMFNALMCGRSGGVNMADYFLPPNSTGVSPALEASAFLYRALVMVDLPLQSHLEGLGVEPQFFALRWIRVLFGREFNLQTLMILWDALLSMADSYDTNMPDEDLIGCLNSPRRVFIIALALSMLLYLRLTLFAAPSATTCLQKLLNFPQTASIEVLIQSARILCPLVKETASNFAKWVQNMDADKAGTVRKSSCKSLSHSHTTKVSPEILQKSFPDFYWEEKWKTFVLRKDTQLHCENKLGMQDQGSAFAGGIDHLLESGNTSTSANKRMTCARAVKCSGGEVLPFAISGSSSMQGALQEDGATPQFTGKGENVQQTLLLVADNSNQGDLKTSRLETNDDFIAVGGTPTPVSNLPKISDSSYDYESTDSSVPTTHGSHQTSRCIEEKDSLTECLRADKGPKSLFSINHLAQADAVSPLSKSSLHPRKYWIWSFGKSRGQCKGMDKKVPSHVETSKEPFKAATNVSADATYMLGKEKPLSKSKELNSSKNHTNQQCSDCCSAISGKKDQVVVDHSSEGGATDTIPSIANFVKEASHLTDFQRLGHCMSNEIQVIETAVARILTSETKMGSSKNCELHSGMAKSPNEANSSEHVPNAVQRAIEELKNISNKLLQM